MGPAILAIVVILYFVLAYFAARTWKAWHVVMLVGLFLLSFTFMFLAAATLKVQKKHRERFNSIVAQLEQEVATQQTLTYGSRGEPGALQLRSTTKQVLIDRGRAWRNLRFTSAADGQITLNAQKWGDAGCQVAGTSAAEDAGYASDEELDEEDAGGADGEGAAGGAAGRQIDLEANTIVYAFTEAPMAKLPEAVQTALVGEGDELLTRDVAGNCKVPYSYMGEFRVEGDPGDNVTLVPSLPLTEEQIAKLDQEASELTWVLYESMPVDSHETFAGLSAEQLQQLGIPSDVVAQYERDQQRAEGTDPPERKWIKVRFLENHTVGVDVKQYSEDVEEAAIENGPLADSYFDESGRSLLATLDQRQPTTFREGEEVMFDWATAQSLINDGKAEKVEEIYDRRLRDYAREFRSLYNEIQGLDRQIEIAQADQKKLEESLQRLDDQLAFQTAQHADLKHDADGLAQEMSVLNPYLARVEKKWASLRADLSRLYRANRQLANR